MLHFSKGKAWWVTENTKLGPIATTIYTQTFFRKCGYNYGSDETKSAPY